MPLPSLDRKVLGIPREQWAIPAIRHWLAFERSKSRLIGFIFVILFGATLVALGVIVASGQVQPRMARSNERAIATIAIALGSTVLVVVAVAGLLCVKHGRKPLRKWLSQYRQCPVCEGSLAGLLPDPDGCTPCPECGAAWRIDAGPKEQAP